MFWCGEQVAALGLAVAGVCDALADGTLGYMVRPDNDVAAVIADALVNPRPYPAELVAEVARRFDTLIGEVTV